ncbi:hypothetical protein [Actinomycetospora sp.]|uniref:hypothetical protein n=1 Tax=Actinomycetospora sp. TaxID=1872135 RepID=UPI002F3F9196
MLTPVGLWLTLLRRAAAGAGERTLTVPTAAGDVGLRVASVSVGSGGSGLALGRLREVHVSAVDVTWEGLVAPHVQATVDVVDLRPSGSLAASGITLRATLPRSAVQEIVDRSGAALLVEITDGSPRVRWARAPRRWSLEVRSEVVADGLVLRAVALRSRRFRWRLPSRLPALPGGALRLPGGLRLVDVVPGHDDVVVTATLAGPVTVTATPGQLLRGAFGR